MRAWTGCSSGIRRFLYISGAFTFLCLAGVISYLIALQFGGSGPDTSSGGGASGWPEAQASLSAKTGEYSSENFGQSLSPETETTGSVQPVLNLIYGYSEKKQKLTALILEIWNQTNGTLSYLTIPTDTGYMISKELYQRFSAIQPEVPQMMRLSGLYQYFEGDDAFDYGRAVIGELLEIEIPHYTAFPSQELKKYFKKNKEGIWKLNKDFRSELTAWQEHPWEEQEILLEETITELYGSLNTNYSLKERIEELAFYKKISLDNITCHKLPGTEKNAGYEVDLEAARKQVD